MFASLARFSIRRRRFVLISFAVLAVVAGLFGGSVAKVLKQGGFNDPAAESSRADQRLAADLGTGSADVLALYTARGGSIDAPPVRAAVTGALNRAAADPAVQGIASFYNTGAAQFVSQDRTQTYAVLTLRGDAARGDALKRLRPLLQAGGVQTRLGGSVPAGNAIGNIVSSDLERSELIAFPITAVLLVLVFGSLVSAGIPLLLGGMAIILAFLVLRILAGFTSVSVFALNVITTLGLGLAIDYSLFILNRYREELPLRGREGALVTAISTTGRAVAFSGLTLAASLAGLFLFPQGFLRSMAMGGIAVALVAVTLALTVLPALIATFGHRTESLRLPWYRDAEAAASQPAGTESGFWHGLALRVMRRPLIVAAVITCLLLVVASPFLRLNGSTPDVRVLPPSAEARQVSNTLDTAFAPHETTAQNVVAVTSGPALTPANIGALYDYNQALAALPGVAHVDSLFRLVPGQSRAAYQQLYSLPPAQQDPALAAGLAAYSAAGTVRFAVVSTGEPDSALSQAQVSLIRNLQPPAAFRVLVGGPAAQLFDLKQGLRDRLPLALGFVAAVMFVVLFLVFGSVTLPLKAMLMNALSLSASYGAMVWIFQDGRLQGLLRFSSLGTVDATQPILMFAIVFGLSMDYEVLLLSRIREEYTRTGDNTLAVARGVEKSGRLITSAAALLVVVFGAFATSSLVFMKELGAGMTLAIALDATIVRALLVPATMKLMGRWNWWAPAPLLHLWQRAGLGDLEGHPADRPAQPLALGAGD